MRRPHLAACTVLPMLAVVLTGCAASTPAAAALSVTVTDSGCELSQPEIEEGPVEVQVINATGSRVDVSLYARSDRAKYDKRIGHVDGVAAEDKGDFEAEAGPGTYQISCELRNGSQTRAVLTATGTSEPEDRPDGPADASAEVTLSLDGLSAVETEGLMDGDVLEVTVTNDTSAVQSVYAARPDGERVAGVEGIVPGQQGTFAVKFTISGGWSLTSEGGTSALTQQTRAFYVGG